jgi:hypothetical protein
VEGLLEGIDQTIYQELGDGKPQAKPVVALVK